MWLAPHWGAWAEQARTQGKKLAFAIPKEGAVQWSGHMVSVTGFKRPVVELTQRYLDTGTPRSASSRGQEGLLRPRQPEREDPARDAESPAVMTAEDTAKKLIRYDV